MRVAVQQDLILLNSSYFFVCGLYLITVSINLLRKDVKLIAFNLPDFPLLRLGVTLATIQSSGAKLDLSRELHFFPLKKSAI